MLRFDELTVGQSATYTRRIGEREIRGFAEVSGDDNPMHLDPGFGARTRFGGVIAHGVLTAGLISTVVGTRLPGPGAIYLSQSLRFLRPVRPGDTITARAEVVELVPERRRVRLATTCTNQDGEVVLDGEALVLVDEVR